MKWVRATYGLPPTVIPPFWHRHDGLVWELSALHQHWLNSYDPEGSPSAPLAWHHDFGDARNRLREWVSTSGTRLDRDRPTRQTTWPGEAPVQSAAETVIADRDADFVQFVLDDVTARCRVEEHVPLRASQDSTPLRTPSLSTGTEFGRVRASGPSHGERSREQSRPPFREEQTCCSHTPSPSPRPAPTSRP